MAGRTPHVYDVQVLTLLNLGPNVDVRQLPVTPLTYPGQEPKLLASMVAMSLYFRRF